MSPGIEFGKKSPTSRLPSTQEIPSKGLVLREMDPG